MKIVKVCYIENQINNYDAVIRVDEREKNNIIARNANEINKLIEQKIKDLSEELKTSAINEVCGKELSIIDDKIREIELKKQELKELLKSMEEIPEESVVADENTSAEPNAAAETINAGEV